MIIMQGAFLGKMKFKSIARIIAIAIVAILLNSCNVTFSLGGFEPGREVVQRAIALQLSLTQKELRQHLKQHHVPASETPDYDINRVVISAEEPLAIQGAISYHLRGTYNLTMKLADGRVTDRGNPFDLYIQRQKEGKTWRLARQQPSGQNDEPIWATYLIKPRGYI